MLNLEAREAGKLPRIMGATITLDGETIDFDLEMRWCSDPICPCDEIMIGFLELQDDRRTGEAVECVFHANEQRYKTGTIYKNASLRNDKLRTAIMEQTTKEDSDRISSEWRSKKQHETMTCAPEEIRAKFDHQLIESEGKTVSLYKIIPHYQRLYVKVNDETYIVDPSFCVRNSCTCTVCFVVVQVVKGDTTDYRAEYSVDFSSHVWAVKDIDKASPEWLSDIDTTRGIFESQVDVYGWLRKASVFLKRCYAAYVHRLTSNGGRGSKDSQIPVIGRNDPCPCGSGKKYKKCCMQ